MKRFEMQFTCKKMDALKMNSQSKSRNLKLTSSSLQHKALTFVQYKEQHKHCSTNMQSKFLDLDGLNPI
jgi:hypothetical protein